MSNWEGDKYLHQKYSMLSPTQCQGNMATRQIPTSKQPSVKAPKRVPSVTNGSVLATASFSDAKAGNSLAEHLEFPMQFAFTLFSNHYKFIGSCKLQYKELLCAHHSASPNTNISNNSDALSKPGNRHAHNISN